MKQLARCLLLLPLCSFPLLAENWAGLALMGRLFIMLFALLPMPFIMLYAWLVATGYPSKGLRALALIGGGLIVTAPLWISILGWPVVLWALLWFEIGFLSYRLTNTKHPVWLGAGVSLVAASIASLIAFYFL